MLSLLLATALAVWPNQTTAGSAEIELPSQPVPLHGTLLTPEGATRAAAVIIPGSGPTDRDGNSPLGVTGGVLRQLAEGLAERGVATVRIDKRGIAGSAAAGFDEAKLTFDIYVADARAWAETAATRTGQPCAWLIGHSEGALVAELAAADNPSVCGLVLLSPVGRKAGDEIRAQLNTALPEAMKPAALAALDDLEGGRTTANIPGLEALFRPSVQPYLISYLTKDPVALVAAYDGPILLGHGSHDIQVTPDNTDRLAAAQPNAVKVIFEGANHVLRQAPMDRAGNMATYGNASIPLDPAVVPAVADFILKAR
ncbi:alpha/beta hydrolase [Brevundimonas sp.]|uniref:alpha/beta hydrolase n=3 Tax=Brevundimonas sp. TaxID=1871086 RepID=UPI00403499F1